MISLRPRLTEQLKTCLCKPLSAGIWLIAQTSPLNDRVYDLELLPPELIHLIYTYILFEDSVNAIKTIASSKHDCGLTFMSNLICTEYQTSTQYYTSLQNIYDKTLQPQIDKLWRKYRLPSPSLNSKHVFDALNILLFPIFYYFSVFIVMTQCLYLTLLLLYESLNIFWLESLMLLSIYQFISLIQLGCQYFGIRNQSMDYQWLNENLLITIYNNKRNKKPFTKNSHYVLKKHTAFYFENSHFVSNYWNKKIIEKLCSIVDYHDHILTKNQWNNITNLHDWRLWVHYNCAHINWNQSCLLCVSCFICLMITLINKILQRKDDDVMIVEECPRESNIWFASSILCMIVLVIMFLAWLVENNTKFEKHWLVRTMVVFALLSMYIFLLYCKAQGIDIFSMLFLVIIIVFVCVVFLVIASI